MSAVLVNVHFIRLKVVELLAYGRLVLGRNPCDLIDIVFWIEGSCERLGLDIPQSAGGRNHNLGTGRRLEQ